jgi:flagellar basal-body rod modification protein FlgD
MTSPLGAPTPISQVLGQPPAPAATQPGSVLGKDAFLKLLVAQLRYQDPSSPADGTAFIAQTAQFTQVEKLTDLADTEQKLLSAQLMLGASTLVGRTIGYTKSDGSAASGVVTAASFAGPTPSLRVGDADVPLSAVTEVRIASTTGTTAS